MTFFVAIFLLSCVLSACAQNTCTYNWPGTGGVLDSKGEYIPGSALCWVDIARNTRPYADKDGQEWLDTWEDATRSYDDCLKGPVQHPDAAIRSIIVAKRCFCNLYGKITTNPDLNDWFGIVCTNFGELLANGTATQINQFMMDVYPVFDSLICPTSNGSKI